MPQGYVHSIYHGGMVDGVGIRSVIFLAGCPLRCLYCHNPDSWEKRNGIKMTVQQIVGEVVKYKPYFKHSGGGVTVSGGEPFAQPSFLAELLEACKMQGIHTMLDTAGYASVEDAKNVLQHVDIMMLDFKAFDPQTYKKVTGTGIEKLLGVLNVSQQLNVPTWIRYVLVPGLTDNKKELCDLAVFLRQFNNIKKIDVLPFHKAGEYKWKEQNISYELTDTSPPTPEMVKDAESILAGGMV